MPLISPPGFPTLRAKTQTAGDNSTLLATDAFVTTAIANAIAGVNPAIAVQYATTTSGDTSGLTYNNGTSGIGATFTGANNTATTIDGHTFVSGDVGITRLLVKNDTQSPSGAFNGIYLFTALHTSLTGDIFTRAVDYDTPSDINNTGAIPVISGTTNASSQWVETANIVTVGTTPLTYQEFTPPFATIMTTTTYDPAAIAQQVVGTTAAQTVTGKILTDTFEGEIFQTVNATTQNITLPAVDYQVINILEVGSSYYLEIPSGGTLEITSYASIPNSKNVTPGTILATQKYTPTSFVTYTLGTTLAAIDTVNATLAFTVPPNGIVDVEIGALASCVRTASGNATQLAILNHTGGGLLGDIYEIINNQVASTTQLIYGFVKVHLTGLTPGPIQVDLAGAYLAGSGNSAALYAGNSSSGVPSPLVLQAKASI